VKRLAVLLAGVASLVALALPAGAAAHPLGNFTVNRYAGVELSGGSIYVHYVLDLAEIPTFQQGDRVRAPGFAAEAARRLELVVDGERLPLRVIEHRSVARPGAGGLETLRFDAVYRAEGTGTALALRDRNFGSRIGWREITVGAADGATLRNASVPAVSESDELRSYPKDLLRSPLDVQSATATFALGDGPGVPPRIDEAAAPKHEGGGFEALINRGDLSIGVILLSLLIAAFWGAAHALTPGHGKALVAGYLVGTKGKPRHAFLLGATVTITHTAGVFALGLVTLALSQFIVPETLYPWLTLASGLLVVAVGASVLRMRLRTGGWNSHHQHADDEHGHSHGHGHDHGHAHDHAYVPDHANAHQLDHAHHHAYVHDRELAPQYAYAHDHPYALDHGHAHEHEHDHEHAHAHGHATHQYEPADSPSGSEPQSHHHDHGHAHALDHGQAHDLGHATHLHEPADARSGSELRSHRHDHGHGGGRHPHGQHDDHADHDDGLSSKGILGVGVAAGLLPCPSALVVLLSAIALHRIGFGLALIVAFSLGLAATITAIGLVAVLARRAFGRLSFNGRLVRALPAVSALVILLVGVAITVKAIPNVL